MRGGGGVVVFRKRVVLPGHLRGREGPLPMPLRRRPLAFLDSRVELVYTMAEHSERVVEVDLRPMLYAKRLADTRAASKRELLLKLAAGVEEDWGRYGRHLFREFEEFGLAGGLTEAGLALAKIIEMSRARARGGGQQPCPRPS